MEELFKYVDQKKEGIKVYLLAKIESYSIVGLRSFSLKLNRKLEFERIRETNLVKSFEFSPINEPEPEPGLILSGRSLR